MNDDRAQPGRLPASIDVTVPSIARVYDYLLGGKDHFAADQLARRVLPIIRVLEIFRILDTANATV